MGNEADFKRARRKEVLLAQSAVYRAGLSNAQNVVKAKLQRESLAQILLGNAAAAVFGVFKRRSKPTGFGWGTVAPLALSGISILVRKIRLKPVLRGVLITGVVGAVASVVLKRKKARAALH